MTALLASAARCHFSVEGVPKSGLAIYNNVRPFNAKAAPFVARPKSSAEVYVTGSKAAALSHWATMYSPTSSRSARVSVNSESKS